MLFVLLLAVVCSSLTIPSWEVDRAMRKPLFLKHSGGVEGVNPMLNKAMQVGQKHQNFTECQEFEMEELNFLLRKAYSLKHERFEAIYAPKDDGRKLDFTPESLENTFRAERMMKLSEEELVVLQAAKCAEFASLYVHHIPEEVKPEMRKFVLPLMDEDNLFKIEDHKFLGSYSAAMACVSCHM